MTTKHRRDKHPLKWPNRNRKYDSGSLASRHRAREDVILRGVLSVEAPPRWELVSLRRCDRTWRWSLALAPMKNLVRG